MGTGAQTYQLLQSPITYVIKSEQQKTCRHSVITVQRKKCSRTDKSINAKKRKSKE